VCRGNKNEIKTLLTRPPSLEMLINPLITIYLRMRLVVIIPVAVEKLAPEKSAKIKTRQEALQTIFFDDLDIFYPGISTCLGEREFFNSHPL
jgi:hypothetical protein